MVSCEMVVFHSASRHDLDESWYTHTFEGIIAAELDLMARGMRWMGREPWEADTLHARCCRLACPFQSSS